MGATKDRLMDLEDEGLSQGFGGAVCGNCMQDSAIAEFIHNNGNSSKCDYCHRKSRRPFACDLDRVVQFMNEAISKEWTDPVDELPYVSEEGGYLLSDVFDGAELLYEIGFDPKYPELFDDVASYFSDGSWCRRNAILLSPAERHKYGWQRFCREVKPCRRYTFWNSFDDGEYPDHPDHLPPAAMLSEIVPVVSDLGLIRTSPIGTKYWRVQEHDVSERLQIPERFTSPPIPFATQPNRMSPAGRAPLAFR